MRETNPIRCPICGAAMNRHAEKVDYGAAPEEAEGAETPWDGALMEFHTCPQCAHVEERSAACV
jgi:hypothetical protein